MHCGHWPGQIQYFFHTWPHLQFLANEAGRKISTPDHFHDSRKGTIPLDHVSNGTSGLSGLIRMAHGRSLMKHLQCHCLHQQPVVHSDTHDKHLEVLEQVLTRLNQNHLEINLEKCIFGNKEVSYLVLEQYSKRHQRWILIRHQARKLFFYE
jgi:hypothetical protein